MSLCPGSVSPSNHSDQAGLTAAEVLVKARSPFRRGRLLSHHLLLPFYTS